MESYPETGRQQRLARILAAFDMVLLTPENGCQYTQFVPQSQNELPVARRVTWETDVITVKV